MSNSNDTNLSLETTFYMLILIVLALIGVVSIFLMVLGVLKIAKLVYNRFLCFPGKI